MKTVFCTTCGKKVPYIVYPVTKLLLRKTKGVTYVEQIAICQRCHDEVYVPEIADENATERELAIMELRERN